MALLPGALFIGKINKFTPNGQDYRKQTNDGHKNLVVSANFESHRAATAKISSALNINIIIKQQEEHRTNNIVDNNNAYDTNKDVNTNR